MKHLLFSFIASAALAAPAMAQQAAPTGSLIGRNAAPAATSETIGYAPDTWQRMTVEVTVGGRGPYRFIVDTGAERTVISSELAQTLGLGSGGRRDFGQRQPDQPRAERADSPSSRSAAAPSPTSRPRRWPSATSAPRACSASTACICSG